MKPTTIIPILFIALVFLSASSSVPDPEPSVMKGITDRHNHWRNKVGVKPLTWSKELEDFAQKWANELARRGCDMEHRPNGGPWDGSKYGENIYWSDGMKNNGDNVVDEWASEIQYFDTKTGKCKGGVCGHYTQVVWSNTTQVGCGMAKCGSQEIWVCNYSPPGNYIGQKPY